MPDAIGPILDLPAAANRYQAGFVARVARAFRHATGHDLPLDAAAPGESAWFGEFALLTHRGGSEAVLNYGNLFAQALWACGWDDFTRLPSRATAPQDGREARAAMMDRVMREGFVSGYDGERVATDGGRFIIRDVTIWRLRDQAGDFGVAAFFRRFDRLA
jgi:hypothetical protein